MMASQGDGAWEPRCGEKRAPSVAHGTHQNQYTKRRALLHCGSNHTSSNNDSDDNVASSEDGAQRDQQHGHFAETGFAAQHSARADVKGAEEDKASDAAQDADSDKTEATLPVAESGVLVLRSPALPQQGAESSGRHKGGAHGSSDESKKGRRRKQNSRDADASSGDNAVPMGTEAAATSADTDKRASKLTAFIATPVAAHAVTEGLAPCKSGVQGDALASGADASTEMRGNAPDAAMDQCAEATKCEEQNALQADGASAKDTEAARLQGNEDCVEAATSSGAASHPPPFCPGDVSRQSLLMLLASPPVLCCVLFAQSLLTFWRLSCTAAFCFLQVCTSFCSSSYLRHLLVLPGISIALDIQNMFMAPHSQHTMLINSTTISLLLSKACVE